MGYTRDAIKGLSWMGAFRIVTRVMSFARTAIIARLLTPSQFGLFGIAALVLSFIEIITESGINIVLTQKKDNIDEYINTAWVTSIIRGFIIAIIIIIGAPFIAQFFESPNAYTLILLISIVPILRGFINPSIVKFTRDLRFNAEFLYRSSIFFVESCITVLIVFIYSAPEGLVLGLIGGALFEVVVSFLMVKPVPRLHFKKPLFLEVIHKGKWTTITGIFGYSYQNIDDAVIGKQLGTSGLGLYDMAYRISSLPISEVSDIIGKVTFPIFVKMSDDKRRLQNAYVKSVSVIVLLVLPICIVFYFFPEQIIRLLLGDQWVQAASVLKILAISGAVRAIVTSINAPMYALSKQEMVTVITFVSLVGLLLTIVPFVTWWGLPGAALSSLFGTALSLPLSLYYLRKVFS